MMEDSESKAPLLPIPAASGETDNSNQTGDDLLGGLFDKKKKRKPEKNSRQITTDLHKEAEVGNLECLKYLMGQHPNDLHVQDEGGHTPLHLAAKGLHKECCEVLIDSSQKEVNLPDKLGNTPLLLAVSTGSRSLEVIELLISKGASVKITNRAKLTALHLAAKVGDERIIEVLIKHGESKVNAIDTEKQTPLHLAARFGFGNSCKLLLKEKADPTIKDMRGYTALHWAAKNAFTVCCDELINLGIDVNMTDSSGNTPLHVACLSNNKTRKGDCVELLLKKGASAKIQNIKGETAFHLIQHEDAEIMKKFVGIQLDLSIPDINGKTALHLAAEKKKCSHLNLVIKIAKENGLDFKDLIDTKDQKGRTVLHAAVDSGNLDSCKAIVKCGVDLNITLDDTGSALHIAAENGYHEICNFLIAKGIKVDILNNKHMTPLHLAAKNGHHECCKILLRCLKVKCMAQDNKGMTALHYAAEGQHSMSCKIFMQLQPTAVMKPNNDGMTPLHIAIMQHSLECCQALVTDTTEVWLCDKRIVSPVKYAFQERLHEIFNFLITSKSAARSEKRRDIDFHELLKESLEKMESSSTDSYIYRQFASSIINSCYWEEALANMTTGGGNFHYVVKSMPETALVVLDKSMTSKETSKDRIQEGQPINNETGIYYNFSCLDPVYMKSANSKEVHQTSSQVEDQRITVVVNRAWRQDHALSCMISCHCRDLLNHSLVTHWINYKSATYVRYVQCGSIVFASLLALLLTIFTATSCDWQYVKNQFNLTQTWVCVEEGKEEEVGPEVAIFLKNWGKNPRIVGFIIMATVAIGILHDIYRILLLRLRYIKSENVTFLLCGCLSICFVGNFSKCSQHTYLREDWQWIVGLIAIFTTWLYLVLVARHLPLFTPFMLRLHLLFKTALTVALPFAVVPICVLAAERVTAKGTISYNQNWSNILMVFTNPIVSTGIVVVVTVILSNLLMGEDRGHRIERYKETKRIDTIQNILDTDLLYPFLRRRYYTDEPTSSPPRIFGIFRKFLPYNINHKDVNISVEDTDEERNQQLIIIKKLDKIESILDKKMEKIESALIEMNNAKQ